MCLDCPSPACGHTCHITTPELRSSSLPLSSPTGQTLLKMGQYPQYLLTRVGLDFVTILNRILKLNFQFIILIKVSEFNLNQFVLAMLF